MASTTMPSNNWEATVFSIKQPKSSNYVRRWFHILKHATFKNRQNDADSLKTKPNHDSASCTPEPSTTEGEPESPQTSVEELKEPTGSHTPSSTTTTTSKAKPKLLTPSFKPLHQTLGPVPEDAASPSVPKASSSPSASAQNSTRAAASKSRQLRKTTMITPELMQQIRTSNRRHSSSPLLNGGGEPRTKTSATVMSTNRAKEVLASPLRWSEQ